jgi:ppGpp synthetase/RelA/SpoT-type nucleotidyltranferase
MTTNSKKQNIPIERQVEHIEEYKKKRSDFEEFSAFMKEVLQKAINQLGLIGFADARAKSLVSFSNKIILKDKYKNPLTDMTDLCGARVVVHFKSQVDKICQFIKDNFKIDEANSLDLKSKLQVSEFGYRSIHYIVTPVKDSILGIKVDDRFKDLKAEIQVRTLAEHIWADISHDRIYKTELKIPDEWKREAAQLSAMLESADTKFAGMAAEIDSLATVYELQYDKVRAATDILKLQTLIKVLQDNSSELVNTALKLSTIYRVQDTFSDAIELLKPLLNLSIEDKMLELKLRFEYGVLTVLLCGSETDTPCYREGVKTIQKVLAAFNERGDLTAKENKEELSYIYFRAGKLLQRNPEETRRVAELFRKAHNIMPENPLYMVSMMESLVTGNIDSADYNISLFKASIIEAIRKLEELIEIGIKRLPAFFALGHCFLFLDDEEKCVSAYANAIDTILCGKFLNSRSSIDAEIALTGKLMTKNPNLAGEAKLYLNIAMYLLTKDVPGTRYMNLLKQNRINEKSFRTPVVIIAGGASKMDETKVDYYKPHIREMMHGFKGTIISGGTTAGIPGLAGRVKASFKDTTGFELVSYLPDTLPEGIMRSDYYDYHYGTSSDNFSALDIFVCWADLICNGIDPKDVVLIGIDGGSIATMEYKIALSLGAKVGLLLYSGRAASEFLQDVKWRKHPNLLVLPDDPYTVWALVNQRAETMLTDDEIKILAPQVHDYYRDMELLSFKSDADDINKYKVLMPWTNLNPSLQSSNLLQVKFYELLLKRVGLSLRKAVNPLICDIKAKLTKDNNDQSDYDTLVAFEHARWNAERLLDGWRYGPAKDIARKLNPCLVPWKDLDPKTKQYDYIPVDNIPILLAKIGYEVYKVDQKAE